MLLFPIIIEYLQFERSTGILIRFLLNEIKKSL